MSSSPSVEPDSSLFSTPSDSMSGSELLFFQFVLILSTLYARRLWESGIRIISKRQSFILYSSLFMALLCVVSLIPLPAVSADVGYLLNDIAESALVLTILIRMSTMIYALLNKFPGSRMVRSNLFVVGSATLVQFVVMLITFVLLDTSQTVPHWDDVANAFETWSYFALFYFQVTVALFNRADKKRGLSNRWECFGPRTPYIIVTFLLCTHEVLFMIIGAIIKSKNPEFNEDRLEVIQAVYHRALMLTLTFVFREVFVRNVKYEINSTTSSPKDREVLNGSSAVKPTPVAPVAIPSTGGSFVVNTTARTGSPGKELTPDRIKRNNTMQHRPSFVASSRSVPVHNIEPLNGVGTPFVAPESPALPLPHSLMLIGESSHANIGVIIDIETRQDPSPVSPMNGTRSTQMSPEPALSDDNNNPSTSNRSPSIETELQP